MSTFAGIELLTAGDGSAGAVFYLVEPSTESETQPLEGGAEIEVARDVRAVVVRGLACHSYRDAFTDSLACAQEGLDLLSARGVVSAAIADVDSEHLAWWEDPDEGMAIRFWGAARMTITVGRVAVVVTDSNGNVRPDPGPPTKWHESMRYFRQSQVTSDLFDAFRSLYLALESLLSTICPMLLMPAGSPAEGEGKWFRRAIEVAAGRVDLERFAPPGSSQPIDALFEELYVKVRTSVFHAKTGRQILLPHHLSDRDQVFDVLRRLADLYLELLDKVVGVHFARGGMFAAAFRKGAEGVAMDVLHLTDD